jgi:hypothetical protein
MPQEEQFITRKKGGITYQKPDYTETKKGKQANTGAYRKHTGPAFKAYMAESDKALNAMRDNVGYKDAVRQQLRNKLDAMTATAYEKQYGAEQKATNRVVTGRDATNARIARERLASRASKAQPRAGRMTSNMAAMGPMAGAVAAADALYAADEATGFRRTKYSGNSGGPSFSMNPYASSNKSSYAGQSAMSKAMGVGKKK